MGLRYCRDVAPSLRRDCPGPIDWPATVPRVPGSDPNSNFVKQIKADFPALRVIDQSRPPAGS